MVQDVFFFLGGVVGRLVESLTSNEPDHWVLAWIRTTIATCFESDAVLKVKTCCLLICFDHFLRMTPPILNVPYPEMLYLHFLNLNCSMDDHGMF